MPIPCWFAYSIRDGSLNAPLKALMILSMNCHGVSGGDIVCLAVSVATRETSLWCLSIITSLLVVPAGADSLVSGSLPCILLRRARATNKANARVPVFKCLRNGVSAVMHLVAGFR